MDNGMQRLNADLGLKSERQDWGIINADGSRLGDFIQYASRDGLTPQQRYVLSELVFASANEAMIEGVFDDTAAEVLSGFIESEADGVSDRLRYWSSLDDDVEFPISRFLNNLAVPA